MHRGLTLLLALSLSLFAAASAQAATGDAEYFDLSEEQFKARYGSSSEAISPAAAGELLLELVNAERSQRRLRALKWHAKAAELSQDQAAQLARTGACSHFGEDGAKCELRFNRLGESDHVIENVFMAVLERRPYLTEKSVRYVHSAWMESKSHRANVLDPRHTHMGSALEITALGKTGEWSIGAVQEFVRSYGEYDRMPLELPRGARLQVTGSLDPAVARFAYIGIGHEELPTGKAYKRSLERPCVYSSPAPLIAYAAEEGSALLPGLPETVIRRVQHDRRSGGFSLFIETATHWDRGAYYITVWAESADEPGALFCAMTQVVLLD